VAIGIRELEAELLVRIARGGVGQIVIRRRQPLGASDLGTVGDIVDQGRSERTVGIATVILALA
jgi:hypothetical protein